MFVPALFLTHAVTIESQCCLGTSLKYQVTSIFIVDQSGKSLSHLTETCLGLPRPPEVTSLRSESTSFSSWGAAGQREESQ